MISCVAISWTSPGNMTLGRLIPGHDDYYPQGKRWWVGLYEKGGKQHEMPAHHLFETYLDAYIRAAGIGTEKNSPLFRSLGGRSRK